MQCRFDSSGLLFYAPRYGSFCFTKEESKKQTKGEKGNVYSPELMHWIGFFYRYASYLTGINSKRLFKKINPKEVCDLYPLYHGLDIQKAINMVFSNIDLSNEKPMDRFLNLYKHKMISL